MTTTVRSAVAVPPPAAEPDRLLARSLLANSATCAVGGMVLVAGGRPFAGWLGVAPALAAGLGVALVAYAALPFVWSRRRPVDVIAGRVALAADVAWVLGALALAAVGPGGLSGAGRVVIALSGLVVADVALAEWLGLRSLRRAGQPNGPSVAAR